MTELSINNNSLFNVLSIVKGTTVDGYGFRTSIYLAGCGHHCKGCHNQSSWNPSGGKIMSLEEILQVVKEEDFNVTISGGDPFYYPDNLFLLVKEIKKAGYDIWVYTGYTIEQILMDKILREPLKYIDVLVDGPYIETLRDPDLPFRGSSNQRIIQLSTYNKLY